MSDELFDQYAEVYKNSLEQGLALAGESQEYFAKKRVEHVGNLLSGVSVSKVLDFGCGTGGTLPLLYEALRAKEGVGLEVSQKSIDVARRMYPSHRFHLMSEFNEDSTFDVAYCNGVFHHIPPADRPEILSYIFRLLKPGGYFAFWENNPWNPGTQLIMRRIAFDRDAVKISIPQGKKLLMTAGFLVVRADSLFFFPHSLRWLRGLEKWILTFPVGGQYLILVRKPGV